MSEKILALCLGIIIGCTLLMIVSTIRATYWRIKVEHEAKKIREFKEKL